MMKVIATVVIIGSPFLGAYASVIVAALLFAVNAPDSHEAVRTGWGFNLYTALVAGGVMGPLAAIGVVTRWSDCSIYCGAIAAVILVALMPHFSKRDFWEGPDLLALPLLMAVSLLAWGIKLKSGHLS
jgi:hypothetical protein